MNTVWRFLVAVFVISTATWGNDKECTTENISLFSENNGKYSVYSCLAPSLLEQHLKLIKANENLQQKYQPNSLNWYNVSEARMNITDYSLQETSFNEKDTPYFLVTVSSLELIVPNLEDLSSKVFEPFRNLEHLVITDLALSHLDLSSAFCDSKKSLKTLDLTNNNLTCDCNLTEASLLLKYCSREDFEIFGNCRKENGSNMKISDLRINEFCESSTEAMIPPGKRESVKEEPITPPSKATMVLIIILSAVLIIIILFAVILFVSNRYCYPKKKTTYKYDTKSSTLQRELAASLRGPSSKCVNPGAVGSTLPSEIIQNPNSAINQKQVKFRPLSREYQAIDDCPIDTQLPLIYSPEKQSNLPHKITEQSEAEDANEWASKSVFRV